MPTRYSPGYIPRQERFDFGSEVASALEDLRQVRRQERMDEEARAAAATAEERAGTEAERRAQEHALRLYEAGVRQPGEAGTVPEALEELRGGRSLIDEARAQPEFVAPSAPGEPLGEDVAGGLEALRMEPRLAGGGGARPVNPSVEAVRRAGQQFYQVPGTELFLDPTQTPEALRARQEEERFQRETARRRKETEAEREYGRRLGKEERGFAREEAEEGRRFRREEIGLMGEQQRQTALARYGAKPEEDPAVAERRQGIVSAAGRPVTELQQDIVDFLAEGNTPDQVLAELERVRADEDTIAQARRYMAALRSQFPRRQQPQAR